MTRGYVDDPRNTDNSWMETVAFNFHDPSGQEVRNKKTWQFLFLYFWKLSGWSAASSSWGWCRSNPVDASWCKGGCLQFTQMRLNFRDVPNFQLFSFNFPGDPVRQPQRFCWEGRWEVRSPLVNGGSICWCEQFRLHDYEKLEINIVEKLKALWWCRLGL